MKDFKPYANWQILKNEFAHIFPSAILEQTNGYYNSNGAFKIMLPALARGHILANARKSANTATMVRILTNHIGHRVRLVIEAAPEPAPEAEPEADYLQDNPFYNGTYREAIHQIELTSMQTKYLIDEAGNTIMAKNHNGDIKKTLIAPFSAYITKDVTVSLDEEILRYYHINGQRLLNGKIHRFNLNIEAEDYTSPKRLATAIIKKLPGPPPATDSEHQRRWGAAIAYLTEEKNNLKSLTAFPRTGWDSEAKSFVMPGGGYGNGLCYLSPKLKPDLKKFQLKKPTQKTFSMAVNGLLSLAHVFDPGEFFIILAHAFLPPLLHWIGNDGRYLLHLYADTGHLKTEISKLMIRLYGPDDLGAITYKWSDTPIGISSRADALKNCLLLLNDLKPNMISKEHLDQWVAFVQSAVDGEGKKRATAGGGAGKTYNCNAIVLSNGEAIPDAGEASYIARMILVPMSRDFSGPRNLKFDYIKNNHAPHFSGIMYKFIEWLATTEGNNVQAKLSYIQSKTKITTDHPRLAANYAANTVAMQLLIEFLLSKQLITPLDAIIMAETHQNGLKKAINFTNEKIKGAKYSTIFLTALFDARANGYAKFSNKIISGSNRIGWEDKKHYYIINAAKDVCDKWLMDGGKDKINNSLEDIKRQIYKDGLSSVPKNRLQKQGRYDAQRKDPATNEVTLVIVIVKDKLGSLLNG